MTTRQWLEEIEQGRTPAAPRAVEQLAALRKMGMVERDEYEGTYHLTPKGEMLLAEWRKA